LLATAEISILVHGNPFSHPSGKITSIDEQYEPNIYAGSRTDYKMDDVSVSNILGLLSNRLDPRVFENSLFYS
jgi:hypothetical protein